MFWRHDVIELARSGADLNGVVSFHGGLDSPTPTDGKNIKCKVLALAGADDPFQKDSDLTAFESEMRDAKWIGKLFSTAVPFTASRNPIPASAIPVRNYNEKADKRSRQAMKDFFAEIFK
ncbi:MAG: dienelactone hydrolase family protein [Limisphaerales bacterium]